MPENSPFAGLGVGNQKGPTNIKSDSLDLDYQGKAIIFKGHVHAIQAGGDLTSKTLRVLYGKDFNDIQQMIADGDVRISQGARWVTGDHAILDQTKHTVVLTGNPVVHDGEDQIAGSLITVDLVTGKSTVEHPRVVIFPKESKNTDNVDSPDHP
jgi:lipopolysaccharide transport protein LptA